LTASAPTFFEAFSKNIAEKAKTPQFQTQREAQAFP
jgi:hypothetical protein